MHLYVFHSMLVFSLAAVPLEVRLCSGKGETQALQHSETRDRSRSTGRPLFNHSFSPYPLQAPRTCCANPRRRAPALGPTAGRMTCVFLTAIDTLRLSFLSIFAKLSAVEENIRIFFFLAAGCLAGFLGPGCKAPPSRLLYQSFQA
jgi:hypothetical protein